MSKEAWDKVWLLSLIAVMTIVHYGFVVVTAGAATMLGGMGYIVTSSALLGTAVALWTLACGMAGLSWVDGLLARLLVAELKKTLGGSK